MRRGKVIDVITGYIFSVSTKKDDLAEAILWLLRSWKRQQKEITKLEEYKWKYEDLCK